MQNKQKLHYAWFVFAGCFITYYFVGGIGGNSFSIYSPFIMNQNSYSKTQMSLIGSVCSLSAVLGISCTKYYYKKISLRNGMFLAILMYGLGYIITALATAYPMYLLGSAVRGFASGLGSLVPITMLLGKWFHSRLTLVTSILCAASGLGLIGIPSLITWLIQTFGLDTALLLNGIAFLIPCLICLLLVRNDPADLGLTAYESATPEKGKNKTEATVPKKACTYLPDSWWLPLCAAVLIACSSVTCFSTMSLFATTEGFTAEIVALIVSLCGICLMCGKLLFGVIATAIGLKTASFLIQLCCAAGLLLCSLVSINKAFLVIGAALLGLSLSVLTVGHLSWVQDWSAEESRAVRIKNFQASYHLGCVICSMTAGVIADLAGGSYVPFYALSAGIAALFAFVIRKAYRKIEQ